MSAAGDPLEVPAFLARTGERTRVPRAPRWKKMDPRPRPEGEVWASAERWEVFITAATPKLAFGRRLVWVVEGRKWVRLHDGEAQCRIAVSEWRQLQRHGRAVTP